MLTYLAAFLLAVVPGALLGWMLPAGRYRWVAWAAAPSLTLGLAAFSMGWLARAGLPTSALAVLVAEAVGAAAAVTVVRLVTSMRSRSRRHRPGSADASAAEPSAGSALGRPAEDRPRRWPVDRSLARLGLPRLADLAGVTLPAAFSMRFGYAFLHGVQAPPGWDAMNHAYFVRRILDTGSTTIQNVCVTGPTHVEPSCTFYPLAANVLWAQTVAVTGGRVSTAMLAWGMLVAPFAMVVGVYAAVRLLGGRPVVASCAAAMPTLLGPLWISLRTGRMTEQAAPSMAAGVALLIALALRGRHPVRVGLLAALAVAGIVMSHSYDVLFMGTVALVMVLVVRERFRLRRAASGLATMLVSGLLILLPFVGAILGADAERTASRPTYTSFGASFRFWVLDVDRYVLFGFPPPGTRNSVLDVTSIRVALVITLLALCASPLAFVLRPLRWARPWVAAAVVWTAIGIWTAYSTNPVATALSHLWYGIRERVRNMIMPVYGLTALAGAIAIGIVVWWLVSRLVHAARGARTARWACAASAVLMLASLTAMAVQSPSRAPLRHDLLSRAPVGQSYARTYQWLAQHTARDRVVAYDRHLEFMTWSYADYDAPLLFGIPPLTASSLRNYDERYAAFEWLANSADVEPSGCLVRKYDIEYLAVGQRRMPGWSPHYSRARLAKSRNVELVHQDGRLRVFKVTDAGRACPSAG
ncbi:DUF6541 family protein [Pedococcus sp. 5OH_020]|uniref:DUF6541 family protein n=1 Tax=Pedococcus sp. 5OH_020 TaxID=2989814 RepID=UPI0022E9BD3C|nr:DUF6541 family protein [Pedococcus sp. 5OH_020]